MRFKGYVNKVLVGESIAEFDYQPAKCARSYRMVVAAQEYQHAERRGSAL